MARKVDQQIFKRILELRAIGLTNSVISQRLGISPRTVRIYTRADRENSVPYKPEISLNVPSEDSI